eukprot:11956778-Karenia_brevis.AAC.1
MMRTISYPVAVKVEPFTCALHRTSLVAPVFITETNRVLDHDDELTIIKTNRDLSLFHRSYKKLVGRVDKEKDDVGSRITVVMAWTTPS